MTTLAEPLEAKRQKLLEVLAGYGRVAVAFSAGVDSTLVAKAAQLACGSDAVAVTAVSPSLAETEKIQAAQLAEQIGIRHLFVDTHEYENADYRANAPDRCYFCKTELYEQLEKHLPALNVDVIVNGANVDDRGDHRPGMKAATEHAVRSPLLEADFTKDDVRALARHWRLPVWDKPAAPCLASRIAYGLPVTKERLLRVERAEAFLRDAFGLRELRVRHEPNDLARIEVPSGDITLLLERESRERINEHLHALGFKFVTVDLEGFRSGSMNAVVPVESLQVLNR